MNDKGWIKLNRGIAKHWIWEDSEKLRAWIDLIMLAENSTHKKLWRGKPTEFKRGDVCLSISELAKRWNWSRDRVRRFLNTLEQDGMVTVHASVNRTTLTLVNYGKYQDKPTLNKSVHKTVDNTVNKTVDNTPGNTVDKAYLKNIKNNKEIKEDKEEPSAISSSENEIEMWNGKPVEDLSDDEWIKYMDSWEE